MIPPKEIDDPTDKQPADWVTEEFMDDPEAKKPQDWDEDAPMEIVDAEDKKPETWLDNEVLFNVVLIFFCSLLKFPIPTLPNQLIGVTKKMANGKHPL